MPRTGALLSLSREHHTSLVMARAVRKVLEDGDRAARQEMAKRIEEHGSTLLAAHFAQEEHLIQLAKEVLNPVDIARILAEHAELRMLIDKECAVELTERLRRFADLIVAHVRYEERVFFPQLQTHPCVASEASLDSINYHEKDWS